MNFDISIFICCRVDEKSGTDTIVEHIELPVIE